MARERLKQRAIMIFVGALCLVTAVEPIRAAYPMFHRFVVPKLTGSEIYIDRFVIYGIALTGGEIYVATLALVASAVALISIGLYLMLSSKLRNRPPT